MQQGNDSRMDGEQTGQACDVETDHETVATKVQRSVDAYFGGMRRRMLTQVGGDACAHNLCVFLHMASHKCQTPLFAMRML